MDKTNHDAAPWLAAVVESSDDAIISKDLNGVIRSWNAGAQQLFGFAPDEAVGQPITIIIPPELHDEEKQILNRLRNGERIVHFETIRRAKNGSRVHVSLTISPVRDSQNRIIGASKIARDIGERQRSEGALKAAELSGRLLQVQDQERRRIARELHDGLGQLLAALKMNVSQVLKEKDKLSVNTARCAVHRRKFAVD
jgi:PAS domain S-box-containing protein